jgi:hypothetical protein
MHHSPEFSRPFLAVFERFVFAALAAKNKYLDKSATADSTLSLGGF